MVQRDFKVKGCVLILVLMEHAQSDCLRNYKRPSVLILILMEHAQKGDLVEIEIEPSTYVLILILMEHAQREHFFIRPYVLICYIETITLINAFASEKCTCFLLKTLQR